MSKTIKTKQSKIKDIILKILLYYSVFLSTILIIGGFYTARSGKEIISNLLFLPIVVFLWIILIQKRKETNPIRKSEFSNGARNKKILTNDSGDKVKIQNNRTRIKKTSS